MILSSWVLSSFPRTDDQFFSVATYKVKVSDGFRYQTGFILFQPEESVVMSEQGSDRLNGISKPFRPSDPGQHDISSLINKQLKSMGIPNNISIKSEAQFKLHYRQIKPQS